MNIGPCPTITIYFSKIAHNFFAFTANVEPDVQRRAIAAAAVVQFVQYRGVDGDQGLHDDPVLLHDTTSIQRRYFADNTIILRYRIGLNVVSFV